MTDRSGVAKQLTHGSLFAGIGGFDRGFELAGFRTIWQVEKEPFCIAVLKTHFPNVERYYDVLKCGHDKIHKLRAVDVLTAGFPCQDLSVAGKRAGLEGSRSGLFWEVVRILGELRPTWFVLENVPGLFSSGEGRDFAVVLNALDELGYGVAWRVLNSQFFGVAQRRRRVFIVGCFGKPCPEAVLFEPEGGGGDIETGGETWPRIAAPIGGGADGAGRFSEDVPYNIAAGFNLGASAGAGSTGYTEGRSPTLRAGKGGNKAAVLATALSSSAGHHGHSSPRGDGSDNIIVQQQYVSRDSVPKTAGGKVTDLRSGNAHPGCVLTPNIVQQAISSKWAKGSSGPAWDEHHNLTVAPCRDSQHEKRAGELSRDPRGDDEHNGGTDDECAAPDSNGVRDFTGLPKGLDSARYRALGNAVTTNVAFWIAERILEAR